jgi:ATP-binding cassette subfamily B protein
LTALDREIETLIFTILFQYAKNHAVLINTHNLRNILKTDYLYVMKNGSIIQHGVPDHLLQSEGYFKSVFGGENVSIEKLKVVS